MSDRRIPKPNHPRPNFAPPPFTVPPGHVAFRLLCHASRIGGVIGKSGHVIKSLQQETGARIRVEDAPPDSPDRVILVVAPVSLGAGDVGDYGDGEEASRAQEALLKVFERILEVAAETDGDEVEGVVSCRLLANPAQVGSVIGKGGNVVEKIRKDTRCRVRVFKDWLPVCALPSDEIVEIEGLVKSVKKALVAVSRKLQDCPPADRMKMMGSRSYEVVQNEAPAIRRETVIGLHPDHTQQRTSALSHLSGSSNFKSSGVHTKSAEVNTVSVLDPKAPQQEVTFRILCSNDRVGAVIGKGGSIITSMKSETGATISISPTLAGCNDRLITIIASENRESSYSPAQNAVVLVFSRSVEGGVKNGLDWGTKQELFAAVQLVVPSNQVGCLIGKGGAIVSEMRKATGTSISIIGSNQVPKCAAVNDQVVKISGKFSNVLDALYNATGRLRDYIFASTQNTGGTRNPKDPVAPGGSQTVGDYLSESLDRLKLPSSLDDPSSPGFWAPQTVAGQNYRGIKDVGQGLTSQKGGPELVSGSKTAVVTSTTVEIVVPDELIGSVYGENGGNLARLRQISGAKVIVYEPLPGANDRTVLISGTPDETRAAQSLLQAFILDGTK